MKQRSLQSALSEDIIIGINGKVGDRAHSFHIEVVGAVLSMAPCICVVAFRAKFQREIIFCMKELVG